MLLKPKLVYCIVKRNLKVLAQLEWNTPSYLSFLFHVLWLYEFGSLHGELKILSFNIQDVPFSMSLSSVALTKCSSRCKPPMR